MVSASRWPHSSPNFILGIFLQFTFGLQFIYSCNLLEHDLGSDNSIYMSNCCCFVQSSKIFLYIYSFRSFFNTPIKSLTCGTWHFLKFQQSVGKKDTKKCSSYIFHPLLNCFFLVEDKKNHRMISHFYSRIWYLYICECFICFLALKK